VGGQQQHCSKLQVRQEEPKPNHSAEASSVDTGESLLDIYSSKGGKGENTLRKTPPLNPNNQEPGQRTERKEPGRKQLVKWPKANELLLLVPVLALFNDDISLQYFSFHQLGWRGCCTSYDRVEELSPTRG